MSVERVEGPTPAGGAYAELIHVGGEVVEVVEYDADGQAIARTYARRRVVGHFETAT